MEKPVMQHKKEELTYFKLNNQLNMPTKEGSIDLAKDREAVKAYFMEHVNDRLRYFEDLEEKLKYLKENNYIREDMIDQYSLKFVKKLFKFIYGKKFRFRSFMGAYKFYSQYALTSDDGKEILEKYEDRIAFNVLALSNGDEDFAMKLADEMISQRLQMATPTFLNSGKKRAGAMVSCFLLDIADDMNSIGRALNSALQLSKLAGGVGLNLTNIRAKGDPIQGVRGLAEGVVPIMKILEDSFSYASQGGKRDGAGVVYLNVFHQDIVDFLSVRKENADEKTRIKTLSLGLNVPDKFYELIKKDEYMYLFSPHDVERVYGKQFGYIDITKEYDNMVNNPDINKSKIKARDLETEISNLQNESGYPYIINIDTANERNPIDGRIVLSNLCTEIFQVSNPSEVNNDQTYSKLGSDISCNLASTNVTNLMNSKDFGSSVKTMFRALTQVSDDSNIDVVPSVKNGNDRYHSVGLGAMNLHGFLAKNKIMYGSKESVEFTSLYFMLLNYWTLKESNNIAINRKENFYEFNKSEYADGTYFRKYEKNIILEENIESDKIKKLFKNIFIPSQKDWNEIEDSIKEHGLYNAWRMAVAPTGSISYVNEATASIHPIIHKIEERTEGRRGKAYYPAPYLSEETIPYYKSAYDIDQRKVIDVYASAQKHIDQGASMTLFTRSEVDDDMYEWKKGTAYPNQKTTRDLNILRNYAWKSGIKSVYYIRTFTDDAEVSSIEMCESCSV